MHIFALIALSTFVIVLLAILAYQQWLMHRWQRYDWDGLVGEIRSLNRQGIASIANDYLRPQHSQLKVEPPEMWTTLGGIEGVKAMRKNADVLIALASYAERWNYDEGAIVAQRMRDDALLLRRSTRQILWRMQFHFGIERVPFFLHQTAASYHLMTSRLLALYDGTNRAYYPRLAEALG